MKIGAARSQRKQTNRVARNLRKQKYDPPGTCENKKWGRQESAKTKFRAPYQKNAKNKVCLK